MLAAVARHYFFWLSVFESALILQIIKGKLHNYGAAMTDRHSRYLRSLFIYICISSPFLVAAVEMSGVPITSRSTTSSFRHLDVNRGPAQRGISKAIEKAEVSVIDSPQPGPPV